VVSQFSPQKAALVAAVLLAAGCRRTGSEIDAEGRPRGATPTAEASISISSWPAPASDSGGPRPGMVWIPAGVLKAGTPPERTPRVADEEMAGTAVDIGGFYIDALPWPNEPNAIPTSNVTRDEAEQLCLGKGKRLCTELEWERACKGPENTIYEYGDSYRKDVCGTGTAVEQSARRPTGEHAQCKSGFGVAEMHGGVFEWTESSWGRGSKDGAQGVLRGGNSVAGELVGRCANAIARAPSKKAATMGLRCCAGTKSAAEVKLDLQGSPGLALTKSSLATPWLAALEMVAGGPLDPKQTHAWLWIPVANEELVVVTGCATAPRSCGFLVGRPKAGSTAPLMHLTTGNGPPEITRAGDARHLRIRSLDAHGIFSRDVTYAYGRIDLGDPKRP
jgi:formylglycine-generating enzyme